MSNLHVFLWNIALHVHRLSASGPWAIANPRLAHHWAITEPNAHAQNHRETPVHVKKMFVGGSPQEAGMNSTAVLSTSMNLCYFF